jgi:hypothetical protein
MCKTEQAKETVIRHSNRVVKKNNDKKLRDCLINNGNCQSKSNLEPVAYRACLNLDNDDNKTIVKDNLLTISKLIVPITKINDNLCLFNCLYQSLRTPEQRMAFCNNNMDNPTSYFLKVTKDIPNFETSEEMDRGSNNFFFINIIFLNFLFFFVN